VGLKPILRTTTSFSALTLLVGSFDPQKPVPEMTYNVFSGTLNPTHFTSLSVMTVSAAKTAGPIEMPFGLWTRVGPTNHVLDGVPDTHT